MIEPGWLRGVSRWAQSRTTISGFSPSRYQTEMTRRAYYSEVGAHFLVLVRVTDGVADLANS
jgi:hypothetical protein